MANSDLEEMLRNFGIVLPTVRTAAVSPADANNTDHLQSFSSKDNYNAAQVFDVPAGFSGKVHESTVAALQSQARNTVTNHDSKASYLRTYILEGSEISFIAEYDEERETLSGCKIRIQYHGNSMPFVVDRVLNGYGLMRQ